MAFSASLTRYGFGCFRFWLHSGKKWGFWHRILGGFGPCIDFLAYLNARRLGRGGDIPADCGIRRPLTGTHNDRICARLHDGGFWDGLETGSLHRWSLHHGSPSNTGLVSRRQAVGRMQRLGQGQERDLPTRLAFSVRVVGIFFSPGNLRVPRHLPPGKGLWYGWMMRIQWRCPLWLEGYRREGYAEVSRDGTVETARGSYAP